MSKATAGGFPAATNTLDQLFCLEAWASYTTLQSMDVAWKAAWQNRPCHGTTSPLARGGHKASGSYVSLAQNPTAWPSWEQKQRSKLAQEGLGMAPTSHDRGLSASGREHQPPLFLPPLPPCLSLPSARGCWVGRGEALRTAAPRPPLPALQPGSGSAREETHQRQVAAAAPRATDQQGWSHREAGVVRLEGGLGPGSPVAR